MLFKFLFRDKKASEVMSMATLIEVILILIIVALMAMVIAREMANDRFEKRYLAQDMAMFIDALYASPTNLVVRYPQKTQDYSIKFEDSRVIVYRESEGIGMGESFFFTEDAKTKFEYKTIKPYIGDSQIIVGGDVENLPIIFTKSRTQIRPFSGIFVQDVK
jgi:hypothetical protein